MEFSLTASTLDSSREWITVGGLSIGDVITANVLPKIYFSIVKGRVDGGEGARGGIEKQEIEFVKDQKLMPRNIS